MDKGISLVAGLILLSCFGLLMVVVAVAVSRGRNKTCEEFLAANRELRLFPMAMSIAASWIWAPALFVAAQKSFQQGIPGLFWYCCPNFLSLAIFGTMALRLRQRLPKGYTFPQYILLRHGRGVHTLYLIQFFVLQICCFAVQLLAGAKMMHALSGLDFTLVTLFLASLTLLYASIGGIRASVATDFLQMALILAVIATVVPLTLYNAGGIKIIERGFGGWSGNYFSLFNTTVAYSFGIPVTISLMSGPIGDQMHWQRGFAVNSDRAVTRAYLLGALLFVIVPFSLGFLGFTAAGLHANHLLSIDISNKNSVEMVGPITVAHVLPRYLLLAFALMILSGLCSTLDSVLCAISSLVATDLFPLLYTRTASTVDRDIRALRAGRLGMIATATLAVPIANLPGLTILHLFIFYGTWRASTMVPTYLTLFWARLNSKCVFVSIAISLLTGAPMLAYGNLYDDPDFTVAGSISVLLIGVIVCIFGSILLGSSKTVPMASEQ